MGKNKQTKTHTVNSNIEIENERTNDTNEHTSRKREWEREEEKKNQSWLCLVSSGSGNAADVDEIRHSDRMPELHHSICSGSVEDFLFENTYTHSQATNISVSTWNRFMLLSRNFCVVVVVVVLLFLFHNPVGYNTIASRMFASSITFTKREPENVSWTWILLGFY